jgi:sterol 3beta-glucosyltransferase
VEDSGDSDDEVKPDTQLQGLDGAARLSRLSSAHDFQSPADEAEHGKGPKSKHPRALSEHKLLRSLPKLKVASRKEVKSEAHTANQMSSSQFLPPRPSEDAPAKTEDEPPLKHKSKATPGEEIHVEKRRGADRKSRHESTAVVTKGKESVTLAKRLQEIFEFGAVEDVISGMSFESKVYSKLTFVEYPCWLLQSILLQGYMYITQKHICFYAYIPRKHVRRFTRISSSQLTVSSTMSARLGFSTSAGDQNTTDTGLC